MPRGRKKAITDRQEEILDLYGKGESAADIADTLGMSTSAVYQQISRLRSSGHLAKKSNGRRSRRAPVPVSTPVPSVTTDVAAPSDNGSLTLEEHVERDLEQAVERLGEVETEIVALEEERQSLSERQSRLGKAKEALAV